MLAHLKTPIALVGKGVSTEAVARLLKQLSYSDDEFFFYADQPSDGVISNSAELFNKNVQTLIVSPGYPLSKAWIQEARDRGIEISSEIDFASRFLEKEKTLLITGSLAKSTTTSLLGWTLDKIDQDVFVGGNLGLPLATYVTEVLAGTRKRAVYVVLELSSFQLECAQHLRRDHAVLTFLCENHLERYRDLHHYYDTKLSVLNELAGKMVVNSDCPELMRYLKEKDLLNHPKIIFSSLHNDKYFSESDYLKKKLVGTHNHENMNMVAHVLDLESLWSTSAKEAILNFKGLAHRMERVELAGNTTFRVINDSKATAIESVETACKSVLFDPQFQKSNSHLWLLLGGRDKKLPWEKLKTVSQEKRLKIILFGEARNLIKEKLSLSVPAFEGLYEALSYIHQQTCENDCLLLSPGGSSLDEFKNFEERGEFFKKWVGELWD
jgi:UDP-N-acetylmuramoylalanine--D-glutamate ligase